MRLEIKYNNCRKHKHMEAKQYATKQPMDHWRNQRVNKKNLETNKNEQDDSKPMGHNKSSSKREVYSNTILPQEKETSQINNLTLHLKQLEKEE